MKQLIILNIINLILLGLVAVCMFVLPLGMTIFLGAAVLVFAIYSNYVMVVRNQDDDYLLKNADKKGIFRKQVNGFIAQRQSLEKREDTIGDDEKLREVYELVCRQVNNNIDSAIKFMEMYDYVQRPSTQYLDDLFLENKRLIVNFNEVVEQFIKIENSVRDEDTTYIDDLLVSLREMH
ncbi:MAG: hypothetical protein PUC12_09940 [Clostridiales bacterium]|nr:hypothetical protein [Clostridiales bacterium]